MKNQRLAWLSLVTVCIVWGTTYLFIRIVVQIFPPFLFLAMRQVGAGIILGVAIYFFSKNSLPDRRTFVIQSIAGFFMITLGNGLVGWAEKTIPSGITALLCSTSPLWINIIQIVVNKHKKTNVLVLCGILCGGVGMVFIFRHNLAFLENPAYLWGIIITLVSTIAWAVGSIWLQHENKKSNPMMNAAIQMFSGGILLFLFSLAVEDYGHLQWTREVVLSLLYLTIIGSALAYGAYSYALKKLPMSIVSMYAYINPLIAVILGWLILKEELTIYIGIAFLFIIAGIWLVDKGYHRQRERQELEINKVKKS